MLLVAFFLPRSSPKVNTGFVHVIRNFNENLFYEGIGEANRNELQFTDRDMLGGLVPHHDLVGGMIAGFFRNLSERKPATLILIGPNHNNTGDFEVLTSDWDWASPFGVVEADKAFVMEFIQSGLAIKGGEILSEEQSLTALIPFIKYYLPETKVVPVVFKSTTSLDESMLIADFLYKKMTENKLLVASVDFSHYLSSNRAYENDQMTYDLIFRKEIEKLFSLDSDYLDSPQALSILIKVMEKMNASGPEVLSYKNWGNLFGGVGDETTSYFSLLYMKR